ncbi:MAG: Uncharacterised protein [Flavobacteriaceae bacterium]|nr:MAG: Uncharacterised protein [Flavobacteriaceae bacterium]
MPLLSSSFQLSGTFNAGESPCAGSTERSKTEGVFATGSVVFSMVCFCIFSTIFSSTTSALTELSAIKSNFPFGTKLVITKGMSLM